MRKRRGMYYVLLSALTAAGLMAACGAQPKEQAKTDSEAVTENGGEKKDTAGETLSEETLNVALSSNIGGLDPKTTVDRYSANVYGCIYETLLAYDDNENIVPGQIVKSYEQTDDVTYHFNLKENIHFHNGQELKAGDVKFSLERGINTSMNYLVGDIDHVEVLGDYEFNIVLGASNGAFLAGLTTPQTGILSEKTVTEGGDSYQMNPVGTGPYRFESWEQGVSVTLALNEDYHGEKPYYHKIVFYEISDDTTRANQLEVNKVNAAILASTDISRFESNADYETVSAQTYGLIYFGMNTNSEKVADENVRKAIAYAIDTEAITKAAYFGYADTATSILNPNLVYSDAGKIPVNEYDPQKAKELLEKNGYGSEPLKLTMVIDTRSDVTSVGTMIKSFLMDAGIECEVVTGDKTSMSGSYYADGTNYDIFVGTWYCATPDVNSQIFTTFHSSNNGATGGYVWMHDDGIDKLIEDARKSTDSEKRQELYSELQEFVYENKWWVPISYYADCWGVSADLDISQCLDPAGTHQWWKAEKKN
ncbi:MAG: ABC transporter substrate-binding protein [Lachnospiraceae bacterium]|nr:ABC transporter substrate-binding protein [Lachnospiraceae bacterium]